MDSTNKSNKNTIFLILIIMTILAIIIYIFFNSGDKSEIISSTTDNSSEIQQPKPEREYIIETKPTDTIQSEDIVQDEPKVEEVEEETPIIQEKKLEVEPNDDEEIKSGKINISIEELNILIETIGLSTLSKDKLNDLQLSLDKLKNKKYIKSGKIFINEEDKRDILIVFGNEKVFINKDGYPEININLTKPTNFILHFNIGVASKVIDSEEEKLKKVQEKIFNDKDKIEKIFLFGYACDIGSYDVNTRLSKKRAENVMELFKTSKIDMLAIPKGEVSLDITDSPEDIEMIRSGNRRTEIIVIYKDI